MKLEFEKKIYKSLENSIPKMIEKKKRKKFKYYKSLDFNDFSANAK